MLRELCLLCVLLNTPSILSYFRKLNVIGGNVLHSVKRRPDRFTDWEVRKKGEKNDDSSKSGISTTVVKASAYQRVIADNIRISDSTSSVNRRTKTSPTLVTHILETNDIENEDYVTGLVIERLGKFFDLYLEVDYLSLL
jgi:hypothetical protein